MAVSNQDGGEPIAIVGMSCTLAGGVDTTTKFWQTLLNQEIKQSARIPASRFNIDAYFTENAFGRPAAIGSRGGYFLETELNAFDAGFFGYEADEAKHMDPQHFRVLESVYECLESAGRTMEEIRGTKTAVYIGNFSLDQVIKSSRNSYDDRHLHEVIGVDPGLLSSRVSYCYDLKGPVYTTNTGCTSSLFALHTAAMALRSGECSSAIVGGVNLLQGPEAYSSYSKFGIMSPDSMCHSFDARCNGYCRAEGVGTLYVKRLSDAIHDKDPIRGVIRSIAVNSNGFVPGMPLFVPNEIGLKKAMDLAYAQSNLDPKDTAYVESHGIGMILGEIAEANAIGQFMNQPEKREGPMLVGSLKPNFGHQEAASGIFVLMKAAMMTEAGVIPGHAGFKCAHPMTDHDALNIKVQTENLPWPDKYSSRRVGLSSYGWSGTNAHILMENVQTLHPNYAVGQPRQTANYDRSSTRPFLVTFSAFNRSSLDRNIARHELIADKYFMSDLAYTLNLRRSRMAQRAFTVAQDGDKSAFAASAMTFGSFDKDAKPPKVGLVFTASTTDLKSIAAEFIKELPEFVKSIKTLDAALKQLGSDMKLEDFILDMESTSTLSADVLDSLRNVAIQVALIDVLISWNISWDVAIKQPGHELATMYAAGELSATKTVLLALCTTYSVEKLPALDDSTQSWLDTEFQKLGAGYKDWQQPRPTKMNTYLSDATSEVRANLILQIGSGSGPLASPDAKTYQITNLVTTLQAIGELYLLDHPVDLGRVNAVVNSNQEPLLLVDLPPYAWDHSQSYSEETYANQEHRLNEHPYHDLLGRRVFGLTPHTMVWKNKLSFRDLPTSIPWVPNEKPLTTLKLPEFLSMTVEALSQAFKPEHLDTFQIQDFKMVEKLQYAEDCDEIELQTSMFKLPGSGGGADSAKVIYGISIESVKKGIWTTHCEASVAWDKSAAQVNGVIVGVNTSEIQSETITPQATLSERIHTKHQLHPDLIRVCLEQGFRIISGKIDDNLAFQRIAKAVIGKSPADKVQGEWKVYADGQHEINVRVVDGNGDIVLKLEGVEIAT